MMPVLWSWLPVFIIYENVTPEIMSDAFALK